MSGWCKEEDVVRHDGLEVKYRGEHEVVVLMVSLVKGRKGQSQRWREERSRKIRWLLLLRRLLHRWG